jgi:hypothetical protein
VVTADHAHSDVRRGDRAGISLSSLLSRFRVADPSDATDESDLIVCPNMRAAEVYVRRGGVTMRQTVARALLDDDRVDQVIWREPPGRDGDRRSFRVATRDRGWLRFAAVESTSPHDAEDDFGGRWRVRGDLTALDASLPASGRLTYGAYPNAFERIATGLQPEENGQLWVTARPGHEFETSGQSVHHRGGSHGTLHELDSLVPLLVAGAPEGIDAPAPSRIVDVEPLCRQILGLPVELVHGESRVGSRRG